MTDTDPFAPTALAAEPPAVKPKKKKRGPTPTKRSLDWLQERGFIAGSVEKWIPNTPITVDFLGFIDIIALAEDGETWAIQATSDNGGNVAARVRKIEETEDLAAALARVRKCGWKLVVFGWRLDGDGQPRLRQVDLS